MEWEACLPIFFIGEIKMTKYEVTIKFKAEGSTSFGEIDYFTEEINSRMNFSDADWTFKKLE